MHFFLPFRINFSPVFTSNGYVSIKSKTTVSTSTVPFLKKRKKFPGGRACKTTHYVQDILCLPRSWCKNPQHVVIPCGTRRSFLAENGLLGKIQFDSDMSAEEMRIEVCKVFSYPMGLSASERKLRFLQRTGASSRTLCVPSVSDDFEWNACHVSTLAKSGGIIYIQAIDMLNGMEVCFCHAWNMHFHENVEGLSTFLKCRNM